MADITETTTSGRRTVAGIGLALVLAGCLLTAGTVVLDATDSSRSHRALAILAHALCAALPIALGLFRLSKRRGDRFARLLIATGLVWSATTLAQSDDSTLYSIGRAGVWLVEVAIVYLLLAFPDGRLTSRIERTLFGALLVLLGLLYLPSVLFGQFPVPSPWSSCGANCPHNALMVTHGAESFIDDFVRPLREGLTVVLFAGVAAVLVQRARRGPPVLNRLLGPLGGVVRRAGRHPRL